MKRSSIVVIALALVVFVAVGSAHAGGLFDKDLSFGQYNDIEVSKLQEFLADQGIYTGQISGNFFSLTLRAVTTFQKRQNILPAGGYFGPKTRAKANAILGVLLDASKKQAEAEYGGAVPAPIQTNYVIPPKPTTCEACVWDSVTWTWKIPAATQVATTTQQAATTTPQTINMSAAAAANYVIPPKPVTCETCVWDSVTWTWKIPAPAQVTTTTQQTATTTQQTAPQTINMSAAAAANYVIPPKPVTCDTCIWNPSKWEWTLPGQ